MNDFINCKPCFIDKKLNICNNVHLPSKNKNVSIWSRLSDSVQSWRCIYFRAWVPYQSFLTS